MTISKQKKAFCALEFAHSSTVDSVEKNFQTKLRKYAPHRDWVRQFDTTTYWVFVS